MEHAKLKSLQYNKMILLTLIEAGSLPRALQSFGVSPLPAMRCICFKPWRRSPSPSVKSTVVDELGIFSLCVES
ncbi:hypothetical protein YC2023_068362 [Brassica napus]